MSRNMMNTIPTSVFKVHGSFSSSSRKDHFERSLSLCRTERFSVCSYLSVLHQSKFENTFKMSTDHFLASDNSQTQVGDTHIQLQKHVTCNEHKSFLCHHPRQSTELQPPSACLQETKHLTWVWNGINPSPEVDLSVCASAKIVLTCLACFVSVANSQRTICPLLHLTSPPSHLSSFSCGRMWDTHGEERGRGRMSPPARRRQSYAKVQMEAASH